MQECECWSDCDWALWVGLGLELRAVQQQSLQMCKADSSVQSCIVQSDCGFESAARVQFAQTYLSCSVDSVSSLVGGSPASR